MINMKLLENYMERELIETKKTLQKQLENQADVWALRNTNENRTTKCMDTNSL